jgi:hypothetical protein
MMNAAAPDGTPPRRFNVFAHLYFEKNLMRGKLTNTFLVTYFYIIETVKEISRIHFTQLLLGETRSDALNFPICEDDPLSPP